MGQSVSLSWQMVVIELISVILLFVFLRRFAFPSIIKAMQDRARRIQSDLDTAEATRREAEELKAHLEQELIEKGIAVGVETGLGQICDEFKHRL